MALEAAAAEDQIRRRQGAQGLLQELKCRAAAAEAEHVAALKRGSIAALMRDTVKWAQSESQPAWANGHAHNADGAGAAIERLHTVTPTHFRL